MEKRGISETKSALLITDSVRQKELITNLLETSDADITLEKDHFEKILGEFDADSKLGVAGGMVYSCIGDRLVSQNVALISSPEPSNCSDGLL